MPELVLDSSEVAVEAAVAVMAREQQQQAARIWLLPVPLPSGPVRRRALLENLILLRDGSAGQSLNSHLRKIRLRQISELSEWESAKASQLIFSSSFAKPK